MNRTQKKTMFYLIIVVILFLTMNIALIFEGYLISISCFGLLLLIGLCQEINKKRRRK